MAGNFNKEEVLALANLDAEYAKHLDTHGKMPGLAGSHIPIRESVAAAYAEAPASTPADVKHESTSIQTADGTSIPIIIWAPASSASPPTRGRPLVFFIHGGGFIIGSPYMDAETAYVLVRKYSAVCISVDYRLAPESPFPGPVQDSWAALKWAAAHATSLGASPATAGFVLVGGSSGANIATALTYLARDEDLSPPLTGVVARMPQYFVPESVPSKYTSQYLSWEQCRDADALPSSSIDYFVALYKPDTASPLFSPFAQARGHAGIPPMYFQVCGYDPLRDDALIYARELTTAGCEVEVEVYKGLPHGFFAFYPMLEASKRYKDDTIKAVGRMLKTS